MSLAQQGRVESSLSRIPLRGYYWRPERYGLMAFGLRMPWGPDGVEYLSDALEAIATAWLHMHARELVEQGRLEMEGVEAWCLARRPDLPPWDGGPIQNVIVLQGGHKLGKSVLMALVILWLTEVVDRGLIGAVYAPTVTAAASTVWRYVRQALEGGFIDADMIPRPALHAALMGGDAQPRLRLRRGDGISTRAVPRGGTASVQGVYGRVSVAFCEEAEGIQSPDFFNALRTMMAGGIRLWVLNANPQSPVSPFARLGGPTVRRFSLSGRHHPNVTTGKVLFPGAVNRAWIDEQLDSDDPWAEPVEAHDPELGTFELPWRSGIWRPFSTWFWRVDGVPPPNDDGDVWISGPLYRRACRHVEPTQDRRRATFGIDCAGGGADRGVIVRRWAGSYATIKRLRSPERGPYIQAAQEAYEVAYKLGVREIETCVDGGGGYGLGIIEGIRGLPIASLFETFVVCEVHSASPAHDRSRYGDRCAEGYGNLRADILNGWALVDPPAELEIDLTHRRAGYETITAEGMKGQAERIRVRKCEPKPTFKDRVGRSPDDGDAHALAASPWGAYRTEAPTAVSAWKKAYGRR